MTTIPFQKINKSMFFKNFCIRIKNNKKILIIISVLQFIALPLFAGIAVTSVNSDTQNHIEYFALISIFSLCLAFLSGIIIACNNFSYLYKKTEVDMIYSLPIKAKTRFASDFFSGFAVYSVPYILCVIAAILILVGGSICSSDIHNILFENHMLTLAFQAAICGFCIMAMFYTLTVLVLVCCGTLFETILNIIFINAMIPGIITIISVIFFKNLYGINLTYAALPLIGYTSPAGALIYILINLSDNMYSSVTLYTAFLIKWIVIYVLVTALIFIISMILYKRRKAEDVSKPYVYKMLYYFIISSITISICTIARYNVETIVPVVIFSAIVYMLFEVITNRGFKKFWKSAIRYSVTMVSVLILCLTAIATNGFGIQNKTPSVSSIKSVEISYTPFDMLSTNYNSVKLNFTEKDIIKRITEVQKKTIETFNSGKFEKNMFDIYNYYYTNSLYDSSGYDNADIPYYNLDITYNMKAGSKTSRSYKLTFEEMKMLFSIELTDQAAKEMADSLYGRITEYAQIDNYTNKKVYTLPIYSSSTDLIVEYNITLDGIKKLQKAYENDYKNMTMEELLTPDSIYCKLTNSAFPIRSSFKETIAFLQENKFMPNNNVNAETYLYADVKLYTPDNYTSFGSNNYTATFGSYYVSGSYCIPSNSSVISLMKVAKPVYLTTDDCYVLMINGSRYVIPKESSNLAERVYKTNGSVIAENTDLQNLANKYKMYNNFTEYCNNNSIANFETEKLLFEIFSIYRFDERLYSSFDDFYNAYYGEEDASMYSSIKTKWYAWKLLNKYYGNNTLDDYCSKNNINKDESIEIQDEWHEYEQTFPKINYISDVYSY